MNLISENVNLRSKFFEPELVFILSWSCFLAIPRGVTRVNAIQSKEQCDDEDFARDMSANRPHVDKIWLQDVCKT